MPSHIVVGGGVNGLSVAWGLAERGADVLVLDKGRLGAGASGIAGGIVRNYYRSEAITELVRLSLELFEEDPDAYGFRQAGYIAAVQVPEQDIGDGTLVVAIVPVADVLAGGKNSRLYKRLVYDMQIAQSVYGSGPRTPVGFYSDSPPSGYSGRWSGSRRRSASAARFRTSPATISRWIWFVPS